MRKHLSNKNSRNGTDPPQDGINTLPGKDSHLCLIVCFASSSEHTISNRLSAGPLTQTGLPDGRRLFHSTGKQQGGGGEGFFFFFCRWKGQLFYAPHPDKDGDETQVGSQIERPPTWQMNFGCIYYSRY